MTAWTPEQRRAIETVGTSLLVSAAAGSGKTSVLAERCVHLICDAKDRCAVNRLLVVTFTEAAAAEMKKRITDRLAERVDKCSEAESRRLRGELMLIEQANISTLHSFCLRLIRQNFHRLDLDPTARVIDGDEAALLRSEIVKAVFAEQYESGDDDFAKLIEAYGDGRDENLMHLVLQTHRLMESLVDPTDWRRRALRRIEEGGDLPLEKSEIGQTFLEIVREDLEAARRLVREAAEQMPADFSKYRAYLNDLGEQIEDWPAILRRGYDALSEAARNFEPARAPSYPDMPGKTTAKELLDRARGAVEEFQKLTAFSSDEWRAGLRAIAPHATMLLSLVEDFGRAYQKRKRELGGLDFADQERFALRLLQMPEVVATCHAQFKHVLVDEYQDINSVQEAILAAVGNGDNHFYVGDVKQSIYRFRLAESGRFLEKSDAFGRQQGGLRIDLNANFRSRAGLLGAINGVFRCLMSKSAAEIEYDQTHHLNAGADYPEAGAAGFPGVPIELHLLEKQGRGESAEDELDRTEREAFFIARQISQMIGRRKATRKSAAGWESRDLRYSDIAILLRAPTHKVDYFADALRQHNIPVHTEKGVGFFEAMEIRDMLALLNLLDNQQQDVPLAAVLRSPIGGIDADGLAKIRLAFPEISFHRAARQYAANGRGDLAKKLDELFLRLADWRRLAQRRPLAEVVWKIYTQTGYLTFCAGLPDGAQRQANLLHFHERCKQYGRFGHGLYRFLRFVEELQAEQETARPSLAEADENSVRLMSIHASKGLEFPVVFVPDLGKSHNLSDIRGSILAHRQSYLGLASVDEQKQIRYPSLAQILVRRQQRREMLAEELRVLYVAMTRAKEHLVLIGTTELSAIETWHRWAEHHQTMPPEQFLSGKCLLDWLGPAALRLEQNGENMFDIFSHTLADIAQWQQSSASPNQFTPRQQQFADLKPIAAATDETAERIIAKLNYRYPHQSLTLQAAARAVSAVSKEGAPLPILSEASDEKADHFANSNLKLPRWLRTTEKPEGTEIGSATHRVLQHLHFEHASNRADIERQIDSLITRRLLMEQEKSAVQIDSILWLMSTEIGALLKNSQSRLIRELPVFFTCEPKQFDPSIQNADPDDQIMLRGRLDAVIETGDGLILLDYKTDHVSAEEAYQRAGAYERQIDWYRQALTRIGGQNVKAAYIIFLTPHVIVENIKR